jgi:hypothetical protein
MSLFYKSMYFKTEVFQCKANKYHSFSPFPFLEKSGSNLFLQYSTEIMVLENTFLNCIIFVMTWTRFECVLFLWLSYHYKEDSHMELI